MGKRVENALIVVAVLAIVGGAALGLTTALSPGPTASLSKSSSVASGTGTSTSLAANCTLANYPDVLNDTIRLRNSTLLELGGSIQGLELVPHSAFFFGFIPSQNATLSGEIQTNGIPITVQVVSGNGSANSQSFFDQTGTDVHLDATVPVGNSYRLLLENGQKDALQLSITKDLEVLYPGC